METVNISGESSDNGGRQMIEKRMSLPRHNPIRYWFLQGALDLPSDTPSQVESFGHNISSCQKLCV